MGFTEALKSRVRKRAHLSCCLCKALGIEVHHIIPQEDDGPDTEDNAVPLCPSCHETYGSNPQKRKFIREARDLWFEICEKRYVTDSRLLADVKSMLEQVASRDDLCSFKDEVMAAIRQQSEWPEHLEVKIGRPDDESRQEGIRVFDIDDLLTLLYSRQQTRSIGQVGLLLIEEIWPQKGGVRDILNDFMKAFGRRAAEKLASQVIDELEIDHEGLTNDEINEGLRRLFVDMTCYLLTQQRKIEAFLGSDGEWGWRLLKDKPEMSQTITPTDS